MKMARVSLAPMGATGRGGGGGRGGSTIDRRHGAPPAMESTVDAYATRVLEIHSAPEACIDTSLGPYVTALLRCSEQDSVDDITNLPDFESLVELLQEHCTMSRSDAELSLKTIATAVQTGVVPFEESSSMYHPNHYQLYHQHGGEYHTMGGLESMHPLGHALPSNTFESGYSNLNNKEAVSAISAVDEFPPLSSKPTRAQENSVVSPLKLDNLIPVDLLGELDDPSSQGQESGGSSPSYNSQQEQEPGHDAFPPLSREIFGSKKKKSKKQAIAQDLASSLFRPACRSRQASLDETEVSSSTSSNKPRSSSISIPISSNHEMQSTSTAPQSAMGMGYPTSVYGDQYYPHAQEWENALEILHSFNIDLGEDAAAHAAALANMDVNIAQYLIDSALTAPPICRHLLNEGCYRSDCQFSHDIQGHTCVFWVKGRCGKGDSCRFLHGFNEKLLEEFNANYYADPSQVQAEVGYPYSNADAATYSDPQNMYNGSSFRLGEQFSLPIEQQPEVDAPAAPLSTFSFANVASQGYNQTCFQSAQPIPASSVANATTVPTTSNDTVKIPQDVWNPHEKRDSSAFHIMDPIERYREVSTFGHRNDVVDLHFQSTKTFAAVLAEVLEPMLLEHSSVWIVTGTGHHVGSKTHQKGGGVLENAVMEWLTQEGYGYLRGRDRNGHGGALLVKR